MSPFNTQMTDMLLQLHFRTVLFVSLLGQTLTWLSMFQRTIKMKKKQRQIRCSSGASIAGRTDSPLQVIWLFLISLFYLVLFSNLVHVTCSLAVRNVFEALPFVLTMLFDLRASRGRALFPADGCLMVVFIPSQTLGLLPRRMRGPTGNSLDKVPGTVTSGGNEVVRLPHGGDPEAFLQGQHWIWTGCWLVQCLMFGHFEEETATSSGWIINCSFLIRRPFKQTF